MEKIFINVDSYNNEGIKTIQGNNNAETYKIYLLKNKIRLSLVGKTVKLGYVMAGTTKGDIIEDLNITNAEQGEITFPITNKISKKDGVYTCQLAIYGANGFLEYTATFGLTVQANIFTKIAGEIADSKDFTYLENILDKASKLSEKLKENTSSATNINSNLESNITEANNINSKLLENTSTATGLNKNLESNIDLAKEVKETIKDLDTKNIEATEKIETLTGLNSKAEELSDNINKGLPLNSELVRNTESAKVTNTNLAATNQEATTKNTELQASLEKTKEFIEGLDGSQNIPQIRMDVTELQNGLKSNQALAYTGSSISADNTLEGRTEGMKIKGKTMYKKKDGTYTDTWEEGVTLESFGETEGNKISILSNGKNIFTGFDMQKFTNSNSQTKINSPHSITVGGQQATFYELQLPAKKDFILSFKHKGSYQLIRWYNTEGAMKGSDIGNKVKINTEDGYVKLGFFVGSPYASSESTYYDIQIEEGTNSTYFEPYKEDKKDILIKEPLRGFDENTCDIMYEDNGQVKVDRKLSEYTFTGDENWQPSSELQDELICFYISFPLTTATTPILCNNFIQKPTMEKGIECITNNGGGNSTVRIKINKSKLTTPDINGFKAWLKANPTTIVYQLATPVIEVVENCVDIDLDTFGEKTYFNILNSLPGTLDFKVPSNIASIVQSNSKAINELYNLIDTLVLPNILQNTTDIEMLKLEKLK
ncbi:BppU family phage baseplate upper protein [Clostridium perfringens]|uniref:BppU family phage baseplate upper protein n=1 Tax=Clostridium perfringens TaxID=1502 RepID=UPI0039E95365